MKGSNKTERLRLYDGCYTSPISVTPQNWKTQKAKISKDWVVHYRFYDPKFDKPKSIQLRGMNDWKTLKERQDATQQIIDEEKYSLVELGFNPITGEYMKEEIQDIDDADYIVHPDTKWLDACKSVVGRISKVNSTIWDINSVLAGMREAAEKLRITDKPIKDIKRRHVLKAFDICRKLNPNFSNNRQNKYRSYLLSMFKELLSIQAIEYNPITDIPILQVIRDETSRQTLSKSERKKINKELFRNQYEFWRFLQIFFHSGARESELMRVQAKDVDLKNQRYSVLILKGRQYVRVWKVIKDIALPFWVEIMALAKSNDYLFSKGLIPGKNSISASQISRRWKRHVKDKMGITADFYSLKHTNSDDIDELLGLEDAAEINSHTTTKMVKKIYAVGHKERQMKRIKRVRNSFA